MKKIIAIILGLVLLVGVFALPAFADDTAVDGETVVDNTVTDDTTAPDITTDDEEARFYDELLAYVTNGANWAKIGGVVLAIVAAVGTVCANLNKVKDLLSAIADMIRGKATKEDTEKVIKDGYEDLKKEYNESYQKLLEKTMEQNERNNELTAVLSVITLQLVKSPYARTEIMGLLSGSKKVSGSVEEIVNHVDEVITKAEESEEKPDTPALDAIKASVDDTEGESGINLGW